MKEEVTKIREAIDAYASAYAKLENWQRESPLLQIGDQKTGCIGEFYVYLYLKRQYPNATIEYAHHSQKGWDILVDDDNHKLWIQVKTVSAYSEERRISPIHRGWNELHLVYLNRELKPEGFWIISDSAIVREGMPLKGKACPKPGEAGTGSKDIEFGENLVEELLKSLT